MNKRYMNLYEQVRRDIIEGRYEKDSKLPSKRVMAESMGVSVITVEHAYELLDEEGYITPREKSGYFVTFDDSDVYLTDTKETYIPKTEHRVNNTFENDDSKEKEPVISQSLYAKTVRRVLSEYPYEIMSRSPMYGVERLRSIIADYLIRGRRMKVSPDEIVIGAGAEYLYGLIVQTFGRDVIYGIESPSYQKIARVYESDGARLEFLELGSDGIESSELWKTKAEVLHITPYRSFPSGVTASASKKREYLKWADKKDAIIIEDDFESEFTPSRKAEETLFSLDTQGRVIYVNTFTRTIGTYVRVAYMVVPQRLKERLEEKVGFYECPVPSLDQYVIASLIENGDFERHINRVRRFNRRKQLSGT